MVLISVLVYLFQDIDRPNIGPDNPEMGPNGPDINTDLPISGRTLIVLIYLFQDTDLQ